MEVSTDGISHNNSILLPEYLTPNSFVVHLLIILCEGVEHKPALHFAAGSVKWGAKSWGSSLASTLHVGASKSLPWILCSDGGKCKVPQSRDSPEKDIGREPLGVWNWNGHWQRVKDN